MNSYLFFSTHFIKPDTLADFDSFGFHAGIVLPQGNLIKYRLVNKMFPVWLKERQQNYSQKNKELLIYVVYWKKKNVFFADSIKTEKWLFSMFWWIIKLNYCKQIITICEFNHTKWNEREKNIQMIASFLSKLPSIISSVMMEILIMKATT